MTSGAVTVDGRQPKDAWDDLAYVFQSSRLVPWRNALKNVMLGMEMRSNDLKKSEMIERSQELLNMVGLQKDMKKFPSMLSGGERQRVAIARAFYHGRNVLVMDEATSALDHETESEIVEEIKRLKGEKTIIVIAHRLTTVQHCDRIYCLEKGKIVNSGLPSKILAS